MPRKESLLWERHLAAKGVGSPGQGCPSHGTKQAKGESMAKILIVDDEAGIRSILKRVLSKHHETAEAADGQTAVDKVREWRPDILICDLKMPEMDGMEVLRRVQEIDPDLVSVMITAHGTVET
ncbi:MAG: response regulator, partial [Candidatus Omnitrophica bacterium]|nr:response regulator [Candidatus Omnitrophota bacterium]